MSVLAVYAAMFCLIIFYHKSVGLLGLYHNYFHWPSENNVTIMYSSPRLADDTAAAVLT